MSCCNFNGCRRCSPENYDDIEERVEIYPQDVIKALEEKLKAAVADLEKLIREVEAGWTMGSIKDLKNIIEKIK